MRALLRGAVILPLLFAFGRQAVATCTLPLEIMGDPGTVETRRIDLTKPATLLWVQAHGLAYADKGSVQVDSGPWITLNNTNCKVQGEAVYYGGIGGSFPVVKFTLPVAAAVGRHTVRFRFDKTNNVSSGYRVIALNFYDDAGNQCAPSSQFRRSDPLRWRTRYKTPEELGAGRRLWESAALIDSPMVKNTLKTSCAGCHTRDGSDLAYYAYSNESIVKRARFHGLIKPVTVNINGIDHKRDPGWLIASYIRSNPTKPVGRPWNSPFQPGLGLDAKPANEWAAGAGIGAVLEHDKDTLAFIKDYSTSGRLNVRETPIAMQLPDWNHWLPTVHPADAWGDAWTQSEIPTRYEALRGRYADTAHLSAYLASPQAKVDVNTWRLRIYEFLHDRADKAEGVVWSPEYAQKVYSTVLWALVKNWEMVQEFGLQERGAEYFGPGAEPRTWFGQLAFSAGPFMLNIPDEVGIGGSAITNNYFSNAWYHLQLILNPGNKVGQGTSPIDWGYVWGKFSDYARIAGKWEPGRMALYWVKGTQEMDNAFGLGPPSGWTPLKCPISMWVHPAKAGIWTGFTADEKKALLQRIWDAYMVKSTSFPAQAYFDKGLAAPTYTPKSAAVYDGTFQDRLYFSLGAYKAAGVDVSASAVWSSALMPQATGVIGGAGN